MKDNIFSWKQEQIQTHQNKIKQKEEKLKCNSDASSYPKEKKKKTLSWSYLKEKVVLLYKNFPN
jgi:Skp family chaperone for outer membrane proteins